MIIGWARTPVRSAMLNFAGLTSVSKVHTPELWYFSYVCLDSSQGLLPIKGHKNKRCLKDKQVVKEGGGGTKKRVSLLREKTLKFI